ncbi:CHAP domain-containing protein [Acrocarpospora pleiomorpha]|uniref:CHAP domain-containing protein n=1 Tax=Acrocarpospora pleiomorpha TaxID=90975 RepID=UPI0035A23A9C
MRLSPKSGTWFAVISSNNSDQVIAVVIQARSDLYRHSIPFPTVRQRFRWAGFRIHSPEGAMHKITKFLAVALMTLGLLAGGTVVLPAAPAAALGNNYPWAAATGSSSPLGFAYRNCTDYAAWTISLQKGGGLDDYRFKWADIQSGGSGHARDWRQGALNRGHPVNQNPARGSVAWWGSGFGGGYGHVAVVSEVRDAGNTVVVDEYNYAPEAFGQRTLTPGLPAHRRPAGRGGDDSPRRRDGQRQRQPAQLLLRRHGRESPSRLDRRIGLALRDARRGPRIDQPPRP